MTIVPTVMQEMTYDFGRWSYIIILDLCFLCFGLIVKS